MAARSRTSTIAKRRTRRSIELVLAALAACYAVLLVLGEAGRGFPDGYITELDRALRGSRLGAVLVVLLLGIALARGKCTPRTRLGLRLGVAFGAVVLGDWLVFPAIFDGMPSPVERCRGSR